ncbi:hypothetical protein FACS1894111_11100 [Clostridia bacterium]|nr:hypothetical protein FACS1894111_11100 [Clostridia bacterium]
MQKRADETELYYNEFYVRKDMGNIMKIKKIVGIVAASIAVLALFIIAINITLSNGYGSPEPLYYGTGDVLKSGSGIVTEGSAYDGAVSGDSIHNSSAESDKVILSSQISIETKNINKTLSKVEELVNANDGKIATKNINLGDDSYGYLLVKVPTDKAEAFLTELTTGFELSSYNTSLSDVTKQYTNREKDIEDLNKKIALYRELEGQTSIEQIDARISIIDHISSLERQVLSLTESNEDIDQRIEYQDVSISLSAPEKIRGERNYWHNTAQTVVSALQESFKVLVVFVVISLPFVIVIGVPVLIIVKLRKKRKK